MGVKNGVRYKNCPSEGLFKAPTIIKGGHPS